MYSAIVCLTVWLDHNFKLLHPLWLPLWRYAIIEHSRHPDEDPAPPAIVRRISARLRRDTQQDTADITEKQRPE